MPKLHTQQGFTLVEILLVIGLIAIVSVTGVTLLSSSVEEKKFDASVEELSGLRIALVGDPAVLKGGSRTSFGYNGDMGGLPSTSQGLAALVAQPGGTTAFTVNAVARFGHGWNGPYISSAVNGQNALQDAWGRNYTYTSSGGTATITSLGADGAAGGTGMNQDIVVTINPQEQMGRVYGFLSSGGGPFSGAAQVELQRANGNGALTTSLATISAGSQGQFEFTNVPFGPRSITVYQPSKASPTSTIGPIAFTLDKPNYLITTNLTDFNPVNAGLGGGGGGGGGGGADAAGNCTTNAGILSAVGIGISSSGLIYMAISSSQLVTINKIKVNTLSNRKLQRLILGATYACSGGTTLVPCPKDDNELAALTPPVNFPSTAGTFITMEFNGNVSSDTSVTIDFIHSAGCDRVTALYLL